MRIMTEVNFFVGAIVCIVLIWWYDDTRWRFRLRNAVKDRNTALDEAERKMLEAEEKERAADEKAAEYDSVIAAIMEGMEDFNSWHTSKLTFRKVGGVWKLGYGEE